MKIKLITISAVIGFLSYALPYLLDFIPDFDNDFKFFDKFYGIGMSLAFGGMLIGVSIDLEKKYHFVLMSIGIFFSGMFVTFLFDTLTDYVFKTKYYVLFNLIISIICLLSLITRKHSTP